MPQGSLLAVGTGNSVIAPAGVIRPILFAGGVVCDSVNHRLPSGPSAIRAGLLFEVLTLNSSMTPVTTVSRPILLAAISVNQMLPSEPTAIPSQPGPAG